jgi:hypothetical protein
MHSLSTVLRVWDTELDILSSEHRALCLTIINFIIG